MLNDKTLFENYCHRKVLIQARGDVHDNIARVRSFTKRGG